MERNIYKYDVSYSEVDVPSKPSKIIIRDELDKVLDYIINLPKEERRQELSKSEKVIFLDEYIKKVDDIGNNVYYLKIVSLKYNQVREVLNIDTLESRGRMKNKRDGDKEYNHLVLIERQGTIKAAFEYNYYGLLGLGTVISYLNYMGKKYFESKDMDKYYYLESQNEVNRDFLEELNKTDKISMATIVVEKERMGNSDFGSFSNRSEINDNVEIVFKRKGRKEYISKEAIKNYYSNNFGKGGVKRIYLDGKNNKSKVRIDTEEMKEKVKIDVAENIFEEVNSEIMYESLYSYLIGGKEFEKNER